MTQSMWNIPAVNQQATPSSMLREQANYLTNATQGLIGGEIVSSGQGELIITEFRIVVPTLNQYRYFLLHWSQNVARTFPGSIYFRPRDLNFGVGNIIEFEMHLKNLIGSNETQELVASLIGLVPT